MRIYRVRFFISARKEGGIMADFRNSMTPPTELQMRFADLFLQHGDATRAYMEAYPNVKSKSVASSAAHNLRQKSSLKAYIETKLEEMGEQRVAKAQEVLEYLTSVMRGEAKAHVALSSTDGAVVLEKPPDEKEKLRAAELLGKRYRLFTDQLAIGAADVEDLAPLAELLKCDN